MIERTLDRIQNAAVRVAVFLLKFAGHSRCPLCDVWDRSVTERYIVMQRRTVHSCLTCYEKAYKEL